MGNGNAYYLNSNVNRKTKASEERHRCGHRQVEWQEITPEPADVDHAQEDFADGTGEQQAVTEVHDAIEVVAFPANEVVEGSFP